LDNGPYGGEQSVPRLKDLAERLLVHDYHVEVDYDKPRLFLGLRLQVVPGQDGSVAMTGVTGATDSICQSQTTPA
jgi:hypothetical protein